MRTFIPERDKSRCVNLKDCTYHAGTRIGGAGTCGARVNKFNARALSITSLLYCSTCSCKYRLYGSMEYEEDGIVSESCDDSVYLYEEEGFPAQLLSALNDMRQQVGRRKFSAIAV